MLFMGKATISTGPWLCDKLPEGTNKYGDSMAGLHDLHTLTLTWIHLDDCFVNRKLTHALSHQKHRETSVQKWPGRSNSIPSLVVSTPLKNLSSSVGVTIPNIWKKQKNVPNHQAVLVQTFFSQYLIALLGINLWNQRRTRRTNSRIIRNFAPVFFAVSRPKDHDLCDWNGTMDSYDISLVFFGGKHNKTSETSWKLPGNPIFSGVPPFTESSHHKCRVCLRPKAENVSSSSRKCWKNTTTWGL